MNSLTYKDIIDDKIAEWQRGLIKLEEQAGKASSDSKVKLNMRIGQLKSAIDIATGELHNLDEQETVSNTRETKDKILKIFSSIDKEFIGFQEKTPYML